MNIFQAVKESVTTRQAAEHYGLEVKHNGMTCCPFHADKTPSMKVDKRFHCFGCGEDGDVINFVEKLFSLSPKDAAEKLAYDFGIKFDNNEHYSPKPSIIKRLNEEKYKLAEKRVFCALCDYAILLREWKTEFAPKSEEEELHPLFEEALLKTDYVEYLLDILTMGTAAEKADVVAMTGKDVIKLEQRIAGFKPEKATGIGACNKRNTTELVG